MKKLKWMMTGALVVCCASLAMAQERPAARQGQPVDDARYEAMMRRFGEAYSRGDTEAAHQIARRIRGALQGAPEVRREAPAPRQMQGPQARESVSQQVRQPVPPRAMCGQPVPPAGRGAERPCPMAQQTRHPARAPGRDAPREGRGRRR